MDFLPPSLLKNSLAKRIGLVLLVFVVYLPCLFNGFSGDDHSLFKNNNFYHSWSNFPRLFQPGYNIDPTTYIIGPNADKGTGSVAYRPVLSITYFIDYWLWHDRPLGYHLHNLLWHLGNVLWVYLILLELYPPAALATALAFGLHPIQTEAVCSIGYRADLLATFFCLGSWFFWSKYHTASGTRRNLATAALFYFLAVFSKEPALLLPLILMIYSVLFPVQRPKRFVLSESLLWIGIAAFYLTLYFFVFPNPTIAAQARFLGENFLNHILIMLRIWREYLVLFILPWTVTLIPAQYFPPVDTTFHAATVLDLIAAAGYLGLILIAFRRSRLVCFFALWYLIFYLPIANILPNANPMAARYLYLPSVGLLFMIVYGLQKILQKTHRTANGQRITQGVQFSLLALLAVCSFTLSFFWKNDYTIASTWIQNFPQHHKGYAVLGDLHSQAGLCRQSRDYYLQSQRRQDLAPDDKLKLAICYYDLNGLQAAENTTVSLLKDYPSYTQAKILLGDIHMKKGEGHKAALWFRKALQEAPENFQIYDRLVNCLVRIGNIAEAVTVIKKGKNIFPDAKIRYLRWYLKEILP